MTHINQKLNALVLVSIVGVLVLAICTNILFLNINNYIQDISYRLQKEVYKKVQTTKEIFKVVIGEIEKTHDAILNMNENIKF